MKGQIIKFKGVVKSAYPSGLIGWELVIGEKHYQYRGIYRLAYDSKGICLGYTYLNTGRYIEKSGEIWSDYDNYVPAEFKLDKVVRVLVVEEDRNDNRYYKPIYVLVKDIV